MFLLLFISTASAQGLLLSDRYDFRHDHVILDEFNRKYFDSLAVTNSWFNRTTRTFTCEVKLAQDITDKWWTYVKAREGERYKDKFKGHRRWNINEHRLDYASFQFDIKIFQFRNNEYHAFMPMNMGIKVADVFKHNYMGLCDIFKKNGVTTKLPIVKGKYTFRNILPDISKAPPVIVPGKYKVKTTIFDGKADACKLTWVGSIVEKAKKT